MFCSGNLLLFSNKNIIHPLRPPFNPGQKMASVWSVVAKLIKFGKLSESIHTSSFIAHSKVVLQPETSSILFNRIFLPSLLKWPPNTVTVKRRSRWAQLPRGLLRQHQSIKSVFIFIRGDSFTSRRRRDAAERQIYHPCVTDFPGNTSHIKHSLRKRLLLLVSGFGTVRAQRSEWGGGGMNGEAFTEKKLVCVFTSNYHGRATNNQICLANSVNNIDTP